MTTYLDMNEHGVLNMAFSYQNSFGTGQSDESSMTVVNIPSNVSDKEQLLEEYNRQLNFPGYFGRNWDAFHEMLCDLSWIEAYLIILFHEGIPNLPEEDLTIYCSILKESSDHWGATKEHSLQSIFPLSSRSRIETILDTEA